MSEASDLSNVKRGMARGAAWTVFTNWGDRLLGVVSLSVLARLLVPQDFGLVGMAFTAIAAVDALSAFGFDWALVRHPHMRIAHLNTAWTLRLLTAIIVFAALLLISHPVALYFREPRLQVVLIVLAGGKLISGFENIGMVYFRRNFQFEKEFLLQFSTRLANLVVSIPLAFVLRSYWALVGGILATRITGVIVTYILHPYRPTFSLSERKDLFGFSMWLQANSALQMLKDRSTDVILGRTAGANGIAIFAMAHEIANLATTELAAPINRAVFSGYSKFSSNLANLRETYMSVAGIIWLIALPVAAGIACTAPQIVILFLGSKWTEAIPILQILAIGGLASVMTANTQFVFMTIGKPAINTLNSLVTALLLVPSAIILSMKMGVVGAAYAFTGTVCTVLPIIFFRMHQLIGLRFRELLKRVWRPVLATVTMIIAVHWLQPPHLAKDFEGNLMALLKLSGTGAATYSGFLAVFWILSGRPAGAELQVSALVSQALKRLPLRR